MSRSGRGMPDILSPPGGETMAIHLSPPDAPALSEVATPSLRLTPRPYQQEAVAAVLAAAARGEA
jgi:superfamily II DNA or RNA helicase